MKRSRALCKRMEK